MTNREKSRFVRRIIGDAKVRRRGKKKRKEKDRRTIRMADDLIRQLRGFAGNELISVGEIESSSPTARHHPFCVRGSLPTLQALSLSLSLSLSLPFRREKGRSKGVASPMLHCSAVHRDNWITEPSMNRDRN